MKKLIFLIALIPCFVGAQSVYRFNNYTINNGLSQSSVNTIIQDDNSALWIGTQDGLNRFDGIKFEIFNSDEEEGINNPFITSSAKTEDGKLWFGTRNGLTEFNPSTEKFHTYIPDNKNILEVSSISIGEGNDLWIATFNQGVFRFDRNKKHLELFNWGNSASDINSATYVENNLIIRTGAHDLFIYNFTSSILKKVKTDVLGFDDFAILNISVASDSNVHVGTNVGVFQLDIKSNCLLREFQNYPELQNIRVNDVCLSQGQWFFASTGNGLYTIDERGELINSTQDMFQKSALMYNKLNVLFEDKNKHLWIGGARGISSLILNTLVL